VVGVALIVAIIAVLGVETQDPKVALTQYVVVVVKLGVV
jgi:hypothetical protein